MKRRQETPTPLEPCSSPSHPHCSRSSLPCSLHTPCIRHPTEAGAGQALAFGAAAVALTNKKDAALILTLPPFLRLPSLASHWHSGGGDNQHSSEFATQPPSLLMWLSCIPFPHPPQGWGLGECTRPLWRSGSCSDRRSGESLPQHLGPCSGGGSFRPASRVLSVQGDGPAGVAWG